jgi:NOL1/NOP2/fmu family ribosome biogenesis protein
MSGARFVRVESRDAIEWCESMFGISRDMFDGLQLYQRGKGTLWVGTKGLLLDGLRPVDGAGIPFIRVGRRIWKITSVAAIQFGHAATRNVVEVEAEEARALMRGEAFEFPAGDARADLPWRGHVIARFRGVPLGCMQWRGSGVESSLPKGRHLPEVDLPR